MVISRRNRENHDIFYIFTLSIDAIEPLKPSILSDSTSKNVNIDFNLESEIPPIFF